MSNPAPKTLADVIEEFLEDELPPSPSPSEAWVERFTAYDCRYKGPELWVNFIKTVAATGSLEFTGQRYRVSPRMLIRKRERYPEFDHHLTIAQDFFKGAVLEREAFVRAIDGVDEPVFHKGRIAGYKRVKSDMLMAKLLAGQKPKTYGREMDGDSGVTYIVQVTPLVNKL